MSAYLGSDTSMCGVRSLFFSALISLALLSCRQPVNKEELVHREAGSSPVSSPMGAGEREALNARLPRRVGPWSRPGGARIITSRNIFEYMDGAGELYMGYKFRSLDVYEYSSADQDDILVEIYWMETSDDAFGLLSNDWGGEAIILSSESEAAGSSIAPPHRALYGEGLLRIWSDDLYARVMAYRVSAASRNAVVEIGRSIVAARRETPEPALLHHLPATVHTSFDLRPDRLCYFRSHLVLNSTYFLSTGNILNLGQKAEAVTVVYKAPAGSGTHTSLRAILIRYADDLEARQA